MLDSSLFPRDRRGVSNMSVPGNLPIDLQQKKSENIITEFTAGRPFSPYIFMVRRSAGCRNILYPSGRGK